jgi:triacylglycerol lipase
MAHITSITKNHIKEKYMTNLIQVVKDASGNIYLDPNLTTLLANASAEAYTDYANSNNPDLTPLQLQYGKTSFNFIQRFTGFDDVAWGDGDEERYGLIYQSAAQNSIYLIAFRGTSSEYDMILDLESGNKASFRPYTTPENFPADIEIGDGFDKIYSTKNHSMPTSMQQQLFAAIKNLPTPASQIFITGHSLGGALASIFTLDLAVSLPEIAITSITFASPRVGTTNWQTLYNETCNLQNKTIRVRNSYDLVPKVPPTEWPFDFKDIGEVFPVSFGVEGYHIDLPEIVLAWHSLSNYQFVLNKALFNSPQVWPGDFPDQAHPGWEMESNDPYTSSSAVENAQSRGEVENLIKTNTPS